MTNIEKEALIRRIDELCQENERLRNQLHNQQDTAEHNFVRNAREYKRVCDENAKLRELAVSYDSALRRMCDQMQRYVDCHDCILGKDYDNEDSCVIDELREAACVMKVELE